MRLILCMIMLAVTVYALPLPVDTLVTLPPSSSLLLSKGKAEYAVNDSGATVTTHNATFWAKGEQESLQLILPAGIVLLNGSAWISINEDTAHFKVYRGYLRFTAAGGTPGETVSAGYERIVTRVKAEKPRSILPSDKWDLFCTTNPHRGLALGCPAPKEIPTVIDTAEKKITDMIILIHSATTTPALKSIIDSIAPHEKLAENLIHLNRPGLDVRTTTKDLPGTLALSRQERPYLIVDMSIEPHINNPRKLYITISIFDGTTQMMEKTRFSPQIEQTLKFNSGNSVSSLPENFYNSVKKLLFLHI